jgi:thioredoxin 1
MLDVACPSCGETYHVAEEHVGRSLRCRNCDRVFEIAAPQPSSPPAEAATSPAAGARASAQGAAGPAKPIEVTDRDFAQRVLQSPRPVLVDFWAAWCGPCRALAPAVEQLAQEYAGRVTFAKLNADDNPGTTSRYGVMGLPTLVLFKGGREAGRLVGLQPKANIKRAIDQVV